MLCSNFECTHTTMWRSSYMPDNLLQENMKRDDKKSELLILVEGKIKRQTFSLRVFHHLLFFCLHGFLLIFYRHIIVVASLVCGWFCVLPSSDKVKIESVARSESWRKSIRYLSSRLLPSCHFIWLMLLKFPEID